MDKLENEISEIGKVDTSKVTIIKKITEARWQKVERAFFNEIEVTRFGTIQNFRGGMIAAMTAIFSG